MIRTPPGWGAGILTQAYQSITTVRVVPARNDPISVRRIGIADLRWALARGMEDFGSSRTDVIFICLLYPLLGLLLARMASGHGMLPLVFPLASGFALVGPLAAVGLNEMSRQRELGQPHGWGAAFGAFRSPSFPSIALLGLILVMMFVFWLVMSNAVFDLTLGPESPVSLAAFTHDIFLTPAGRAMMIGGIGIGFVFAVIAMTISIVSFPMLLDKNVSLETAVRTSARVVARNPVTVAAWGAIVAAGLVIGSIPLLLGLIFVMPILGHATWHLYRRTVFYGV